MTGPGAQRDGVILEMDFELVANKGRGGVEGDKNRSENFGNCENLNFINLTCFIPPLSSRALVTWKTPPNGATGTFSMSPELARTAEKQSFVKINL